MTERELQDAVIEAAQMFGWLAYHTHDSRRSAAGFPDLVLARRGEVLFVELKSASGKVTTEQRAWLDELAAYGYEGCSPSHETRVWRPVDWTSGLIVETLQ